MGFPLAVTNVGKSRIESSALSLRLVTTAGTAIDDAFVTNCESTTSAAPGETRQTCAAFKVPFGSAIKQVEWPGGQETGVWGP